MKIKKGELYQYKNRTTFGSAVVFEASKDFCTDLNTFEIVTVTPVVKPKLWSTNDAWAWLDDYNADSRESTILLSVCRQDDQFFVCAEDCSTEETSYHDSAKTIRRAIWHAKKALESK